MSPNARSCGRSQVITERNEGVIPRPLNSLLPVGTSKCSIHETAGVLVELSLSWECHLPPSAVFPLPVTVERTPLAASSFVTRIQPSVSMRSSTVSATPKRRSVGVLVVVTCAESRRSRSETTSASNWKRPLPTTSDDSTKSGPSVSIGSAARAASTAMNAARSNTAMRKNKIAFTCRPALQDQPCLGLGINARQ